MGNLHSTLNFLYNQQTVFIRFELFAMYSQVLERENIENKFKELSAHFELALSEILLHNFDISEEVKEQVNSSCSL